MSTMMMESFGQTFVVASSVAKDDDDYLQQQETDEDSGSYYDEDGHSYDSQEEEGEEEEEEEESESSMGGGYLGTAKYFTDARCFEPEMMGFSDSFVTGQDASEKLDFLDDDDEDGSPNASPDSSSRDHNGGMDVSRNSIEASVHEDVLSFDKMLGKRQESSTSLGSAASADLLQYTVKGTGSSLNSSNRPPSSRGMHNASKSSRDRSRSRSNSQQRVRRRSTSRSSQDGGPAETARSLMPPNAAEDDDHEHDLLSMMPLSSNHQPQSARPRAMRKKSLGHDDKISSNSSSSRGKGGSRTPTQGKAVRSSRRISDPAGAIPKEETLRQRRSVGRRGSIENRRQQRRGTGPYMDSSSRRSSGGDSLDSSNDVSLRSNSSRQSSLRHVGSREAIPPRTRSLSSSQGGAAERRRSRTGNSLLSPDMIAEKLLTGDVDNEEEEPDGVFDELRKSQVRNMGRRRSTAGCETMSRRKSVGVATSMEPTRAASHRQLSQRQLGAAVPANGTKPVRRMSKPADSAANALGSNSISGPSRTLRDKRASVSATRARVRRHRSSEMLEVSGKSLEDESEVSHNSRRESGMNRRKMGVKPASYRQARNMGRCKSEPTEVLYNTMYDHHDIDDDTVAAMGPSDTKAKALQRKQAALAASKARNEGKATSKVLQIQ